MSTSAFETRLARMSAATLQAQEAPAITAEKPHGGTALKWLILLPLALMLGAASVIIGGVVQVVIIDGGATAGTVIPPQLGFAAIGTALILSFLIDRILGGGIAAPLAVSVGFIGMVWGEGILANMYPDLWAQIYHAKYLSPALELAGTFGL